MSKVPHDYFQWLDNQLNTKKLKIKVYQGDIIAFKIGQSEYGFARILIDIYQEKKQGRFMSPLLSWVHPRSLVIAPYAFYSNTIDIDTDKLILTKTLPSLFIFDTDVYRGECLLLDTKL